MELELLTDAEKKAYIDGGAQTCPYCSSNDISAHSFDAESTEAWQRVDCRACGREWADVYTLTDIDEYDEDGHLICKSSNSQ